MFEISRMTNGRVIKVNPRSEHYGTEEVPAVDVKIEMIVPNYLLTEFSPLLLEAMYSRDGVTHPELPGIEGISEYQHVRFPNLQPLRFNDKFKGYRLRVRDPDNPAEDDGGRFPYVDLGGCDVAGIAADCKEGGYLSLVLRISRSDVDEVTLGRLGVLTGRDAPMQLLAPEV